MGVLYACKGGRERKRGRERERERDLFLFLKGMTGALAPFSYLVMPKVITATTFLPRKIACVNAP